MSIQSIESLQPSEPLADRAYHALSRAILCGGLPPGTRLSVPELARRLDVSRSPVREAVQRLVYDGLARNIAKRGAIVALISQADFLALLEIREFLEGLAARRATPNATPAGLDHLHSLVDDHESLVASGEDDPLAHVEHDLKFHAWIRAVAANADLTMALERMQARAHLSYSTLWVQRPNPADAVAEHRAIALAIASGDADAADEVARTHIRRLKARVETER